MWTKCLPLILVMASVARASAQTPVRPGPGLGVDALTAPRSALRLGRAPLPSAFRVPIPRWADAADPLRWSLPRATEPPSLAGLPPARPGPDAAPPVDTAEGDPGFRGLELPEVVQQVADLGLRVEGRGELGGVWSSFRPCDPGLGVNCGPGLFPRIRPNLQFGVSVGGTITDRIHVDVDYDQRREFDAANSINVYYEGAAGEMLRRVEMGDVSIDLPASRYLTQGIPAGNFGFKTSARLGELDVEAVWAQQKGDIATREFRLGGAGQEGLVQDQELVLDDADYATGQFFFLVDPARLQGSPHVDILALDRLDAPPGARPRADRLAIYRDEGVSVQRFADQAQAGTFLADAVTADGGLRHSGLFKLLQPGRDYFIHSSGLWIALRAPLRGDEALAVTYLTEAGDQVGDPAPEAAPAGTTPELRLVRGPVTIHQPGQPTWSWEMHQVYRLDSSAEVEPSTLELVVSLGHVAGGATFEEHAGEPLSYLRLFGLDDDAPADRLDEAQLFRPGAELEAEGGALRGTFVVFPTLQPFGAPPPVPSEGLSAAETAAILGSDANPAIYEEPDPVVRASSSRFRLNFRYQVRLEGLLSSFNLGAFGIRRGSERITVEDRLLVRGADYVIDYDLGLVTLLDPEATLGANPDAAIRVSWEQRSLFAIAPTTVLGLHARSPLGAYGQLNFMGLYQAEQSVVRRPQLGTAPGAVLLGGVSGELAFQADWLVRALDAIPGLTSDSVARLDVAGELALSVPEPNRQGATYLDDFEATDEIALSLQAAEWQLGSAPRDATAFPSGMWSLDAEHAAALVWQDRFVEGDREVGFLTPDRIDEQITVTGSRLAEPVLYLTMGGRGAAAPQWRSVTTVLSTTGQDLSRSEYLEFYVESFRGDTDGAALVIDIGTVSEDAFYIDPETGAMEGQTPFGEPWGRGVLDAEAQLRLREVWGPDEDRRGLWAESCEADRLNPLPLGDPRANCTVLNGRPDSEDLNANGVLDGADGPSFRYVVPIGASSPYLVRDRAATRTGFRLFRVPLRGPRAVALNGATDASWRFVKQLRLTVVKPGRGVATMRMARFRIAGSRWAKRDLSGVVDGRTGDVVGSGAVTANVRVGPVSQLTDGAAYVSPPGVIDEAQDPKAAIGPSGVEVNEKSLRLSWEALPGDERAEVYFRYPQQPRNFLEYRQIRFWAVPRGGSWGPNGDMELLFKLGTDPRNYYVYRSRLRPVGAGAGVSEEDWLPEHRVDLEQWFALKAEAERRLAEEGDRAITVWSEDGSYGLVLEDRARAPNLAAVRELSLAVYNGGVADVTGEVWIDDLRLDAGATEPGFAGRVDLDLTAGGVLDANVSFGGRGGRFRQLDGPATYETVDELSIHTTAELGRLAPPGWGVSMPVTVSYLRTDQAPLFLQGTDVRADRLDGLRETGTSRRRVGVSLRKTTRSANPVVSALIDGTTLRVGHVRSSDATVTTARRLDGIDGALEVDRTVADVSVPLVPAFLRSLLRWLAPDRVEGSPFFERVSDARLRLTPERIGLSATYATHSARVWRYDRVLAMAADDDVRPIESPRRALESGARIHFRPLESLTARVGLVSARDVLEPDRATPVALERQALRRASDELWGVPLGWERDRVLTTDAAFRPAISSWLQPTASWSSRFGQRRDPAYLRVRDTPDGPLADLARTYNVDRRLDRGLVFDLEGALAAAILPAPTPDGAAPAPGAMVRWALAALRPFEPIELSWSDEVGSRYDRQLAAPDLGFQMGVGSLEDVRTLADDTAATALRRDGFRARSGVRLGPSLALDLGYTETDARVHDLRAGPRAQLERSWPDVQLSWSDPAVPAWLAPLLDSWAFSTGFVRTERATRLGADVVRVLGQVERTVPLEVRLGFGGLAFSYIGSLTLGTGEDPTGETDQTALGHAVSLSGRVRAPGPLRSSITEPLRVSLSYDYQEREHRRVVTSLAGKTDPTPFIDHVNRRLNLSISTLISGMDVGLQTSYIDRRSFIGTRAGSSQFQLGLFGQFDIEAGRSLRR